MTATSVVVDVADAAEERRIRDGACQSGKGHASPYATGGGGTVLEHAYGAAVLASLGFANAIAYGVTHHATLGPTHAVLFGLGQGLSIGLTVGLAIGLAFTLVDLDHDQPAATWRWSTRRLGRASLAAVVYLAT